MNSNTPGYQFNKEFPELPEMKPLDPLKLSIFDNRSIMRNRGINANFPKNELSGIQE